MTAISIGSDPYNRILEWLYREAAILDNSQFPDWLALMDHEVSYRMPTRENVYPRDGAGYTPEYGFFTENHASLETRVRRLQTEQAWAEQPGSRTRHLVNNVLVDQADDGTFHVRSAFLITRIRSDLPYDFFTGERRDVLREGDGGLKLLERLILLDQTVLKSYNLSIFF